MIQNWWDEAKAVLRRKWHTLTSGNKKISNNLNLHLKELEKEEQTKSKVSRRKEINIREETKEKKTKEGNDSKDQ